MTSSLWPDFEGIDRVGYMLVGTVNALVWARDQYLHRVGQSQGSESSEPWPQSATKQEQRLLRLIDQLSDIRRAQSATTVQDSQFDIDCVSDRRKAWNRIRLSAPEQLLKRYPGEPQSYKVQDGRAIPMREFIQSGEDDDVDHKTSSQAASEDGMLPNSELQHVGPMNPTTHEPQKDDDGVDSLFGEEPEPRDDSPSSQSKKDDDGVDSLFGEEPATRDDSPSSQPREDDDGVDSLFGEEPEPRDDSPSSQPKKDDDGMDSLFGEEPEPRDDSPSSQSKKDDDGVDSLFGEESETRDDSPLSQPKKDASVSPRTRRTSIPPAAALDEGSGDTNQRPVRRKRARSAQGGRSVKFRAVGSGAKRAALRTRFENVKDLVRTANDIESLIHHVGQDDRLRRYLPSLKVSQRSNQEKMDSI